MKGFLTIYLFIVLPLIASNQRSGKQITSSLVEKKERTEYVPTHLRIKRMCGIPDSVEWSYKTKIIYSERILAVIDSLDNI